MQFEVTYVRKQPAWKGQPGTLFTPVPRNVDELANAVKKILAEGPVERITILPTTEQVAPEQSERGLKRQSEQPKPK